MDNSEFMKISNYLINKFALFKKYNLDEYYSACGEAYCKALKNFNTDYNITFNIYFMAVARNEIKYTNRKIQKIIQKEVVSLDYTISNDEGGVGVCDFYNFVYTETEMIDDILNKDLIKEIKSHLYNYLNFNKNLCKDGGEVFIDYMMNLLFYNKKFTQEAVAKFYDISQETIYLFKKEAIKYIKFKLLAHKTI